MRGERLSPLDARLLTQNAASMVRGPKQKSHCAP